MNARVVVRAAVGLALGAVLTAASAKDLFGTLQVEDSPQAAHTKLKALGYSGFGLIDRAVCVFDDKCLATFTGPSITKGFVRFSPNGIRSVYLETAGTDDIVAALTRKHGPAKTPSPVPGGTFMASIQNQRLETHVWNLPTGVQISIGKDGSVRYFSPEAFGTPADAGGVKNF